MGVSRGVVVGCVGANTHVVLLLVLKSKVAPIRRLGLQCCLDSVVLAVQADPHHTTPNDGGVADAPLAPAILVVAGNRVGVEHSVVAVLGGVVHLLSHCSPPRDFVALEQDCSLKSEVGPEGPTTHSYPIRIATAATTAPRNGSPKATAHPSFSSLFIDSFFSTRCACGRWLQRCFGSLVPPRR